MAVAFGTANTVAEQTTVDTTYTAPSGIANGDLLLIWHFHFSGTGAPPTPTIPTGFAVAPGGAWPVSDSTAGDFQAVWLWYRIAASESGNYTVPHASCVNRGIIARVTGNDTVAPFAPNPTQNFGHSGTTTTFTGVTTSIDQELIMLFGADDNDNANTYAVTGYTLRANTPGECLLTKTQTPAGATGSPTMTNNSNSGTPWFGVLAAIQPPTTTAAAVLPPQRTPLGV